MLRPAALLVALAALAGCGASGVDRPLTSATLVLDGPPTAAHVGVWVAVARGYDDAEGVTLRVRSGRTPVTGLRRLRSGSAQLAVVDVNALAIARQRGEDVVGVMAIAQLPLPDRARAALRASGRDVLADRIDFAHAPTYPELVLATTSETLRDSPAVVRAAIAAIARGYEEELNDPQAALAHQQARVSRARRAALAAELSRVEAAFTGTTGRVGALDRRALRAWAQWAPRVGIVPTAPSVDALFPPVPER